MKNGLFSIAIVDLVVISSGKLIMIIVRILCQFITFYDIRPCIAIEEVKPM